MVIQMSNRRPDLIKTGTQGGGRTHGFVQSHPPSSTQNLLIPDYETIDKKVRGGAGILDRPLDPNFPPKQEETADIGPLPEALVFPHTVPLEQSGYGGKMVEDDRII